MKALIAALLLSLMPAASIAQPTLIDITSSAVLRGAIPHFPQNLRKAETAISWNDAPRRNVQSRHFL